MQVADSAVAPCRAAGAAGAVLVWALLAPWVVTLGVAYHQLFHAALEQRFISLATLTVLWVFFAAQARAIGAARPNAAACAAAGADAAPFLLGADAAPDPMLAALTAFVTAWLVVGARYHRRAPVAPLVFLAAALGLFLAALLHNGYVNVGQALVGLGEGAVAGAAVAAFTLCHLLPWERDPVGSLAAVPGFLRFGHSPLADAARAPRARPRPRMPAAPYAAPERRLLAFFMRAPLLRRPPNEQHV